MSALFKIKEKQANLKYIKQNKENLEKSKKELQDNLDNIQASRTELEDTLLACKLISEKLTYVTKGKLEAFLTFALKNIFIDRDYEIKLVIRDDTKKPALELTLVENGIEQEITDAVGGGILSTLGLLMQIYYIEMYNLNRIIFIDEGLKEISTGNFADATDEERVNYLENLLRFLKLLANEKQYKFVIVTHDNNVRSSADKIYEVEKGQVRLCRT